MNIYVTKIVVRFSEYWLSSDQISCHYLLYTKSKPIDSIVRHSITLCVRGSASFSGRVEYQQIFFFKEGGKLGYSWTSITFFFFPITAIFSARKSYWFIFHISQLGSNICKYLGFLLGRHLMLFPGATYLSWHVHWYLSHIDCCRTSFQVGHSQNFVYSLL